MPLKQALLKKGHHFRSETDTEIVAHLMADLWDGDFESTVRKVLHTIEGSYSLVFLCAKDPSKLICAKKTTRWSSAWAKEKTTLPPISRPSSARPGIPLHPQ